RASGAVEGRVARNLHGAVRVRGVGGNPSKALLRSYPVLGQRNPFRPVLRSYSVLSSRYPETRERQHGDRNPRDFPLRVPSTEYRVPRVSLRLTFLKSS